MKRILVIGADMSNATDLIRVHRLVCQFQEDYGDNIVPRHQCILYSKQEGDNYKDHVAVWQTANQITIRFLKEDAA